MKVAFSAASRKLLRAQSVVSDTISNLEEQIRVTLFDRSGRYPKLTPAGVVLLADARSIVTGVDLFKARAKGVSAGLEPELSLVIDVFYPIETITQVAKEFRQQYPGVALRIYVEALGAAILPVLDGRCDIAVIGSLPVIPDTLTSERLQGVAFVMVAARDHPLASYKGTIPKEILGKHTQIILTDRSELSAGREFGVMSPMTWRLADLFAKHHFLLNGLGWGGMPLHAVRKDLEEGRLSVLSIEDVPSRWFDAVNVSGVANQVPARTCRPMVYRAPEADSAGRRQSAANARRAAEAQTRGESLTPLHAGLPSRRPMGRIEK